MTATGSTRRNLAVALALLAVIGGRADEPAPTTGIAAAKRDYEEVKAATTTGAEMQKLALPKAAAPSLDFKTEIALPAPTGGIQARKESEKLGKATAKSKNWLVDAMLEKSPDKRAGRSATNPFADKLGSAEDEAKDLGVGAEKGVREKKLPLDERKNEFAHERASEAPNPLDRYMAAWMTPQDFALLKKTTDREAGAISVELPGSGAPSMASLAELRGAARGGEAASVFTNAVAGPAENPYLAAPAAPAFTAPTGGLQLAAGLAAPAPSPTTTLAPLISDAPARQTKANSAADEFQKAQEDAKYFKQLKRF